VLVGRSRGLNMSKGRMVSDTQPTTGDDIVTASSNQTPRLNAVRHLLDVALRNVDIAAAVLLAISTVATAWCAYQSTRWSGVQATDFAQASSIRIESNRQYDRAFELLNIDANTFMSWVNAYAAGNTDLVNFYQNNIIRPAFLPYLQQWVASQPLKNPNALRNPVVDPAYQQQLFAESDQLRTQSEQKFKQATDANQTSDDYVLATVLFASVLFFAGISSKFEKTRIEAALVVMALIMLAFGCVQFGGLPIQ
jgi:hypothetical protein